MKKKRFSVEHITSVLQQVASGVPVGDVCRHVGISEQTFYRWKRVYGGMLSSEAREPAGGRESIAPPTSSLHVGGCIRRFAQLAHP